MNKDRGAIKWTSLMLPEHVKMLREWQAEDEQITKPDIEFWQLEEMNEKLMRALEQNSEVTVKLWHNGKIKTYTGTVLFYDAPSRKLHLSGGVSFPIEQLIEVEMDV